MEFHGAYHQEIQEFKAYLQKHPERSTSLAVSLYELALLQLSAIDSIVKNYSNSYQELVTGHFDEFLKSRQPTDDPTLISQEYVFLYCHYDPQHGDRDWKTLLEGDLVREIDLLIAKRALASGESEATVNEMLNYGSPAAQQLPHPHRGIYATSIVAQAISSHTAN